MAGDKLHAGIRLNEPIAKYVKLEYDKETAVLDVYITGVLNGTEMTVKGTLSKWVPVQEG